MSDFLIKTNHKPKKLAVFTALTAALLITSGCQSLQGAGATSGSSSMVQAQKLDNFTITGKIGVTTPAVSATNTGAQGGSAFYAWATTRALRYRVDWCSGHW